MYMSIGFLFFLTNIPMYMSICFLFFLTNIPVNKKYDIIVTY